MFFRRRTSTAIVERPVASFVHQLSDEELKQQTSHDIIPFGAGFNINLKEKEDTLMVEKLKAYKAELEAKKAEVENTVIDVEAEVVAYREKLIAEETAKRIAEVAKLNSDIECIANIIAREEAAAAAVETPVDVVTE